LRILIVIFIFFSSIISISAAPVVVSDKDNMIKIGNYLEIYEDKSGEFDFQKILKSGNKIIFKKSPGKNPNFGYSSSVYWLRFSVDDQRQNKEKLYLELAYTHLDYVTFYYKKNKIWVKKKAGDSLLYSERNLKYRNILFNLPPSIDKGNYIYLKVKSSSSIQLAANIWKPKAFTESIKEEQMLFGIFYGIMIVMAVYNLFIFFFTRDSNYFYYVFYIIAYTLVQVSYNGLANEYLWGDYTWWANRSIPFFVGLSTLCILQFTRSFLDTRANTPQLNRLVYILIIVAAITMILALGPSYQLSMQVALSLMLAEAFLIFIIVLLCLVKGYRPARYFLAAWSLFLFGIASIALKTLGLVPDHFMTNYGIQIGSSLETILLSIALADRINILREENHELHEIHKNLEIARKIQDSILPHEIPSSPEISIGIIYEPMEFMAGDFYDFNQLEENKIGVLIADVSGHGIGAALICAMLKVAFSNQVSRFSEPDKVVSGIHDVLDSRVGDQFITLTYCVIDFEKMTLTAANAGHHSVIVYRPSTGAIYEIQAHGRVISVLGSRNLSVENFNLVYGDRVVLFTDGLIECRNSSGDMFGIEKLQNTVKDSGMQYPDFFLNSLKKALYTWRGSDKLEDDLTVITIDIVDS
jgi:serine phosphatase RsbU (regulator of sigma subunit)